MKSDRLDELIEAWCENRISDAEWDQLVQMVRASSEARERFRDASTWHGLLYAATEELAMEGALQAFSATTQTTFKHPSAQSFLRHAAGWLIGMVSGVLLCATAVWSYNTSSLSGSTKIALFRNGDFEDSVGSLPTGFPDRPGMWSGDEAVVVQLQGAGRLDHGNLVQFLTAKPDTALPDAKAIACDLFQWVDLESQQLPQNRSRQMMLELSADFLDDRADNTQPSVTFFCQIYLFRGDPANVRSNWPQVITEAVSSGSAQVTTLGHSGWRTVTARCLIPEQASIAVIHLAARPNLRGKMPADLFVDRVRLDGKSLMIPQVRPQRNK